MTLLQMSLYGSVMTIAIVIIRALAVNRLPKRAFLLLWGLALARLLIPYSLPSSFSVYSLLGRMMPAAEETGIALPGSQAVHMAPAAGAAGAAAVPVLPAAAQAAPPVDLRTAVWLLGALAVWAFFAAAYLKCRREFAFSLPVQNDYTARWLHAHRIRRSIEIRQSDRINAPLTYGVFRPVILMPKTADWDDAESLKYVLEHEYVHIRRFDTVTKLVLTAALCLHWFNPAVWVLFVLFNRDIELSCDEAVIRRFGEGTKSAYARTLIRMEEARSGLMPLCNSFSKSAIEERIIAIMKSKRVSLLTIFTTTALVIGMFFAFATSGETAEAKGHGENTAVSGTQTIVQKQIVTSYTPPTDGNTYYSWDSGDTWITMSHEELDHHLSHHHLPQSAIEWWTAEEYEQWLENEKKELQDVIGSRAWTSHDGWFTWTQKEVDEAVALYESILEDIKNGMLYSKPVDGDGDLACWVIDSAAQAMGVFENAPTAEDFASYASYGLKWDEEKKALFYKGQRVRYFLDGTELDGMGGMAIWLEYTDAELKGEIDVYAVRKQVKKADGSIDPMGPLTGLKKYSQAEFDTRTFYDPLLEAETFVMAEAGTAVEVGASFEERFLKYKDFGISYVEAQGASGAGNVYFNGLLVSRFADIGPDGSAFTFTSAKKGGITMRTLYDSNGRLAGVETVAE